MIRKCIFVILLMGFGLISSAPADNFQVKRISKDLKTVVLVDNESGKEQALRKGDQMNHWTVVDIQADQVVLRREPEEEWLMEDQVILRMPSQHIIMEHDNSHQE